MLMRVIDIATAHWACSKCRSEMCGRILLLDGRRLDDYAGLFDRSLTDHGGEAEAIDVSAGRLRCGGCKSRFIVPLPAPRERANA